MSRRRRQRVYDAGKGGKNGSKLLEKEGKRTRRKGLDRHLRKGDTQQPLERSQTVNALRLPLPLKEKGRKKKVS